MGPVQHPSASAPGGRPGSGVSWLVGSRGVSVGPARAGALQIVGFLGRFVGGQGQLASAQGPFDGQEDLDGAVGLGDAKNEVRVDLASEGGGRIDVLINNAAVFSVVPMNRGPIETIDPGEWDRLMAVNLRGLFLCCRAVLPTMRTQQSGKIITIASGTVFAGAPGRIHYVTSKAATIGFTRTLAREVGGDNITVNCLAPGNTLSEENPSEQVVRFRESSVRLREIKRIKLPTDEVGAMLLMASKMRDFITGKMIKVEGGI